MRHPELVDDALEYPVKCIFLLSGDISNIQYIVNHIKRANRRVFIHVDLIEGISRDHAGIRYIANTIKPDGIITTKSSLVSNAKEEGLLCIQRLFLLDTQSFITGVKSIEQSNPDAVEVLPGVIPKAIQQLTREINQPIIAGGLIKTIDEVREVIRAGAIGISTSHQELWAANELVTLKLNS